MLYIKAVLDGVVVIVFASVFGKGAIFSAISYLSFIGSVLIFCVGTNLMFKTNIKVANLLPSLIFAVLLHSLPV